MKLEIELIPKGSWYQNLRNSISKEEWDKLRKKVYQEAGYQCGMCGASGRLYCHEVWKFDDFNLKQKLIGFKALCEYCHYIKHLGMVNVKIASGELPVDFIETLIHHFCKVNDCNRDDFENHKDDAYKVWMERSGKHWKIDFINWKDVAEGKQRTLVMNNQNATDNQEAHRG